VSGYSTSVFTAAINGTTQDVHCRSASAHLATYETGLHEVAVAEMICFSGVGLYPGLISVFSGTLGVSCSRCSYQTKG